MKTIYRVPTGFKLGEHATVADVVRYEQEELGNDLRIPVEMYPYLDGYNYRHCLWACRSETSARRYGQAEAYSTNEVLITLGIDGDGGSLLFMPEATFPDWLR